MELSPNASRNIKEVRKEKQKIGWKGELKTDLTTEPAWLEEEKMKEENEDEKPAEPRFLRIDLSQAYSSPIVNIGNEQQQQQLRNVPYEKISHVRSNNDDIQLMINLLSHKPLDVDREKMELILNTTKEINLICRDCVDSISNNLNTVVPLIQEKWKRASDRMNRFEDNKQEEKEEDEEEDKEEKLKEETKNTWKQEEE